MIEVLKIAGLAVGLLAAYFLTMLILMSCLMDEWSGLRRGD
jgi:hypothetical protein